MTGGRTGSTYCSSSTALFLRKMHAAWKPGLHCLQGYIVQCDRDVEGMTCVIDIHVGAMLLKE